MESIDKRQELQRVLVELETYKKQMESLRNEIQLLGSTMEELGSSLTALDALKENKAGTEILVSIGSGSFIRAELKDTGKVIVGAGAGVSIEKDVDEAKEILKKRGEEITKTMEKLQTGAVELNNRLVNLNEEYDRLAREIQAGQK
ncbi:MAG: prefoldin subunit alpha [Candidatus Altiarchaeota archaeon]|nr:prefoldin subunit alpha [Candidatus Altiarchaeota archaeon]